MNAHIISIGNELLIGDTVNTNASWLGQFLTDRGMDVQHVHVIGDNLEVVKKTFLESMREAGLVISTGGLGPTHDDVTKQALQDLFDVELALHEPTLEFIKHVFKKRNIPFSKSNYHQAEVPENCEVLFNKQGTAPGMWFEERGSCLAVLPGVPFEMKRLMEEQAWPKIETRIQKPVHRVSRYLVTAGVGESTLSDELIGDLTELLSENDRLDVAYLPDPTGNKIRVTGSGDRLDEAGDQLNRAIAYINERASDVIIGEGKDFTLAEAVGIALRDQGATIGVAESCTGGRVADQLTNIPGSSDYFTGGIVAYSNTLKETYLKVKQITIEKHGAVSRETALQMAKGVAAAMNTDIGLSTTGIAGPGGGSTEKPVGTIWIGYWSEEKHFALKALFTNDRLVNKERGAAVALETVRRSLKGIKTMPYGLEPHFA